MCVNHYGAAYRHSRAGTAGSAGTAGLAQQGWHSRHSRAGTAGTAGLAQQAQQGSLAVPSCWRCSLPDCAVVAQIVEEEFKHTAAKLGVTGQEASALAHQWASPEATGFPINPKDPQDSAHKELHKPHHQGTS